MRIVRHEVAAVHHPSLFAQGTHFADVADPASAEKPPSPDHLCGVCLTANLMPICLFALICSYSLDLLLRHICRDLQSVNGTEACYMLPQMAATAMRADGLDDPELAAALGRLVANHGGEAAEPEGGKPAHSHAASDMLTNLQQVQPAGSMSPLSSHNGKLAPVCASRACCALVGAGSVQPARRA